MKALLIDDERLARAELTELLKPYKEIEIVGEAKNGDEALEKIKELEPDVIFLDIEMPGLNGFDLLKKLELAPHVIFVTAHDNHALDAFKVSALDYLLKPVDPKRLNESINRLIQTMDDDDFKASSNFKRKEKVLGSEDRVLIKDNENLYFPKLKDIRYIESDGNYSKVYFKNDRVNILKSLNYLESRLNPEVFFRANRKIIINIEYIQSISNWFNGGLHIITTEEEEIQVSRRQAIKFREEMMF